MKLPVTQMVASVSNTAYKWRVLHCVSKNDTDVAH